MVTTGAEEARPQLPGRSETVRVLYGAERPDEGTLQVKGNGITAKHPITSMHAGMA